MKITSVECYLGTGAIGGFVTMKINTDSGIYGWGEAGLAYGKSAEAAFGQCQDFGKLILGMDPFNTEEIWEHLHRHTFWGMGGGVVITSAMAAIDIACWDIKGKALGVPVYQLLGGKTREKVRCYASVMKHTPDLEETVDQYRELQSMGFNAAKIFINGPQKSQSQGFDEFYSGRLEDELEKVRRVREAVGPRFDLILENHRGMTAAEAMTFGQEVAKYRPMVFEDPVTPDNIDTMAMIASRIHVPIATGERFINIKEFEMLIRRDAAAYVRPDVCAVGGITASKKIAAIAEASDVQIIPHNPLGPVSTAACLQICASIPNLGIQELPGFCINGIEDAMVKEPLKFEDGFMMIPEAPGIGVELSDDAETLFPAKERGSTDAFRYFDGSVKDW